MVEGGSYDGLFYRPTVVTDVTADMPLWQQEIFAPIAPVMAVDSEDEAIRLVNDTPYGLVNAVLTGNPERGMRVASKLRSGMVHVNDSTCLDEAHVPFGGLGVVRPRRARRRRVEPRGVHGEAMGLAPARQVGVPVLMDPDVLIVGAGPSGAVTALRLAQDGFRVTVLEQGDWPDYSKANVADPEFAVTADRDWGWDPNMRAAPGDYPIDESESDITALMWNGVGGGTIVYAAQWQRNMPSDFRVRTLDGVADDWPFTYEDLEPYYVRVERDFGISGPGRRHRVPARRRTAAAAGPDRRDGPQGRARPQRARLALVAGAARDRHAAVRRAEAVRAARHVPERVRGRREGERRHHALAEGDRASA